MLSTMCILFLSLLGQYDSVLRQLSLDFLNIVCQIKKIRYERSILEILELDVGDVTDYRSCGLIVLRVVSDILIFYWFCHRTDRFRRL